MAADLLTPTEMGREFGMHRREVISKCMEWGVPIFQGRIDKTLFAAKKAGHAVPERSTAEPRTWFIRKKRPEPFDTEYGSIVGPAADFAVEVVELSHCRALEASVREFIAWFEENDGKAHDFGEKIIVQRARAALSSAGPGGTDDG